MRATKVPDDSDLKRAVEELADVLEVSASVVKARLYGLVVRQTSIESMRRRKELALR